tara:strand:+ start:94 stop:624 length:531 start_codon:yes stop_codon:yes gene_type:complete
MIRFLLFSLLLPYCFGKEYKAVDQLDLKSYIGKWYQVYGDNFNKVFQGNGKCATAEYSLLSANNVSVHNEQLSSNNKLETIDGYAYYKDNNTGGYLTVLLDGQMEAPYWVIELGPKVNNLYDYSIVSDNLKLSLFVLARDVNSFYKNYDAEVLVSLKEFGFTNFANKPIKMNQSDC